MATFNPHKVISALPGVLEASSVYFVRTGAGIDMYVTDSTGSVAYKNNEVLVKTVGSALSTSGTVNLDFSTLTGTIQTIDVTGDITFTTSNISAGCTLELRISAGASDRNITWPSWLSFGEALPLVISAGKVLTIALRCTGTTDASIDAAAAISV